MLSLLLTILMFTSPIQIATATADGRELRDMPVMVLYCDEDPNGVNVGGGKDPAPETLIESGLCTPAEGVSLTFVLVNDHWNFEKDDPLENWDVTSTSWFGRCDMDADGRCALNSPEGFDIVIGVFLHEGTVKPGYAPVDFVATTHNFTEFAGFGLALVRNGDPIGEIGDHQTLALNITHEGAPANVLTEWDIDTTSDDETYLATNSDGWVSALTEPKQEVEIKLVNVSEHATITATCSANDDASAKVHIDVDENSIEIKVPDTTSDIRCDIQLGD